MFMIFLSFNIIMNKLYQSNYVKYIKRYNVLKKIIGGNEELQIYFDGRLIYNASEQKTIYYQDLHKKWEFYTNKQGFQLLLSCFYEIEKMESKANFKLSFAVTNFEELV